MRMRVSNMTLRNENSRKQDRDSHSRSKSEILRNKNASPSGSRRNAPACQILVLKFRTFLAWPGPPQPFLRLTSTFLQRRAHVQCAKFLACVADACAKF